MSRTQEWAASFEKSPENRRYKQQTHNSARIQPLPLTARGVFDVRARYLYQCFCVSPGWGCERCIGVEVTDCALHPSAVPTVRSDASIHPAVLNMRRGQLRMQNIHVRNPCGVVSADP